MKKKLMQWKSSLAAGAGVLLFLPPAWAQPTADQIMEDMRGFMADATELVTWIILVLAYLVAAWLIIDGGWRIFKDREGGGQRFLIGVLVAFAMLIFTSFLVSTGQGEIDNIRG
ncbi:MAG: hypothetical protein F4X92_05055 [Gammaproteobacteria bacterium]|nr:hypothetical protein [Gammaproteobacteria bacterium]